MSSNIFDEPKGCHESHDIYLANFIVGIAVVAVVEPTDLSTLAHSS
jgi:hypothetical protein